MTCNELESVYKKLFKAYGHQNWWPIYGAGRGIPGYEPRFEIIVGAILTQMVAWRNVKLALENLIQAKLLSIEGLRRARPATLEKLIRPAGYYKTKTRKLKALVSFIGEFGDDLDRLKKLPLPKLRKKLLTIHGVGEETADSIILYAFGKPSFVVDAYTRRFLATRGIELKTYGEYQKYFESRLPRRVKLWNEYHALIVRWGQETRASQ